MSKDSVYDLVKDSVNTLDFILVDCTVNYGKTKDNLRIIIHHKDKNVTSDDCSLVADIVSRRLDIDDPFDRPYDLIVESPGLEREIKSNQEYLYFLNREFKVFLNENADIVSKEGFIICTVTDTSEDNITVKTLKDKFTIPFDQIKKAKLYCDYDKLLKKNK